MTIGSSFNITAFAQRGVTVLNKATPDETTQRLREQQEAAAKMGEAASLETSTQQTTLAGQNMPVSTAMLAAQDVGGIKVGEIKRLNIALAATPIAQLPEDQYQAAISAYQSMFEHKYRVMPEPPDLSNYAPVKSYATVVVGGKVVAELDNQGAMTSSDAIYARVASKIPDELNGTNGPDLAQARAEAVAKLLGGKVVKSSTAMTQSAFNNYPPLEQPRPTIDYEAMKEDPMYLSLQRIKEQRAAFIAQQQAA